jgi:tetratricopeptide (TPR) repeat protein
MDAVSKASPRVVWGVRSVNVSSTLDNVARAFGTRASIIVIDLQELGDMLSAEFKILPDSIINRKVSRKRILSQWNKSIRVAERCAFAQKLSLEIEDFELSVRACNKGVKNPSGVHTRHWFLSEAANCLRLLGRFAEARETIDEAISSYSPPTDLATLAANYNVRGLILLDQPQAKPRAALASFKRAKTLLEVYENSPDARHWKSELSVFKARIENNTGLAYQALGQTEASIKHFRNSLVLKKSAGDVIGRAQTCVNICRVLYGVRDLQRYSYWKREAMRLIDKYSLRYQQAELLRETGRIDCERNRSNLGLAKLRSALQIYETIGGADHDIRMTQQIMGQCSTK